MRLDVPRPGRDSEHFILPLVNIVFLLLVFFLLAGYIAAVEPLAVDPPHSVHAGPADEAAPPTVLLAADGRLALGEETLDPAELARRLGERLAGETPARVRLKADAGVDAWRLLETMRLLRESGAERVILLTALQR